LHFFICPSFLAGHVAEHDECDEIR
jgi:hypothetical protein